MLRNYTAPIYYAEKHNEDLIHIYYEYTFHSFLQEDWLGAGSKRWDFCYTRADMTGTAGCIVAEVGEEPGEFYFGFKGF